MVIVPAFTSLSRSRSLFLVCVVLPPRKNIALLDVTGKGHATRTLPQSWGFDFRPFHRVRLFGPRNKEYQRKRDTTRRGWLHNLVMHLLVPAYFVHRIQCMGCITHVLQILRAVFLTARVAGFRFIRLNHQLPTFAVWNSGSLHLICSITVQCQVYPSTFPHTTQFVPQLRCVNSSRSQLFASSSSSCIPVSSFVVLQLERLLMAHTVLASSFPKVISAANSKSSVMRLCFALALLAVRRLYCKCCRVQLCTRVFHGGVPASAASCEERKRESWVCI